MKFIEKYGVRILVGVSILIMIVVFFAPLGIKVAKDMWQWALM